MSFHIIDIGPSGDVEGMRFLQTYRADRKEFVYAGKDDLKGILDKLFDSPSDVAMLMFKRLLRRLPLAVGAVGSGFSNPWLHIDSLREGKRTLLVILFIRSPRDKRFSERIKHRCAEIGVGIRHEDAHADGSAQLTFTISGDFEEMTDRLDSLPQGAMGGTKRLRVDLLEYWEQEIAEDDLPDPMPTIERE